MATFKPLYAASATISAAIQSLATSSARTAGYESAEVDNTSNLYDEILISGKITVGTSPTVDKQIDVWVVPEDGNGTYPDVFDGTESTETWTSENVRNAAAKLLASIKVDATSDRTYYLRDEPVGALFGGVVPRKFVLFIAHDTAVNLNATGSNHEFRYTGVHWQSV